MTQSAFKILIFVVLVLAGGYGLYKYDQSRTEARLQKQIQELEAQKQELTQFIGKLTSSRRVAELVVTEQTLTDGVLNTTVLFSEIKPDGNRLPPRFFTFKGYIVHIDAMTIRFELESVKNDDPYRGQSIYLFHRLYGEYQTPNDGFTLDTPNAAPEYYVPRQPGKPMPEEIKKFQDELWSIFWKLADDKAEREKRGVRLVQGEGLWRPVYPDYIYTISIETSGGLIMTSQPIDDLYREFLKAVKKSNS